MQLKLAFTKSIQAICPQSFSSFFVTNHRIAKWLCGFLLLFPSMIFAEAEIAPVYIGAIYNTTGSQALLDNESARGAKLAVQQINNEGGILGHPVELILKNGHSDPEVVKQKAQELANNPNVSVVIGLSDAKMVLAAAPIIAAAKKIFITTGATSSILTKDVPDYLFLSCFSDNEQTAAAANFIINKLNIKTAAVLYDGNMDYSRGLAEYFTTHFTHDGGQVVVSEKFSQGQTDIRQQIAAIKNSLQKPQVIYLAASSADAPLFVKKLRQGGIKLPIMGSDSFIASRLFVEAGDAANNVYYTTHVFLNAQSRDPMIEHFMSAYKKMYGQWPTSSYTALGYDAINLVAAAISRDKAFKMPEILTALEQTQGFNGVTGQISYQKNQHIPVKTVNIMRVMDNDVGIAERWQS